MAIDIGSPVQYTPDGENIVPGIVTAGAGDPGEIVPSQILYYGTTFSGWLLSPKGVDENTDLDEPNTWRAIPEPEPPPEP